MSSTELDDSVEDVFILEDALTDEETLISDALDDGDLDRAAIMLCSYKGDMEELFQRAYSLAVSLEMIDKCIQIYRSRVVAGSLKSKAVTPKKETFLVLLKIALRVHLDDLKRSVEHSHFRIRPDMCKALYAMTVSHDLIHRLFDVHKVFKVTPEVETMYEASARLRYQIGIEDDDSKKKELIELEKKLHDTFKF